MSFDDAQPATALAPARTYRPMALHGAKVSQGSRGDWNATIWVRTEAEAIEIAAMINEKIGRKPRAEVVEP